MINSGESMTDKKNWGSTVLGWFVVKEGEPHEAAAVPDEADAPPPPPPEAPSPVQFVKPVPPAPGGNVDYDAVFEAAGVDAEERGRVTRARDLLAALPAGTDPAVKKQIVEASLKAFGVPIDGIIEAAVQEIQALEGYIRAGAGDTSKLIDESQSRITTYEEEIRRIRQVMEERVQEQQAVMKTCNTKKLEIQGVLEFFGQEAVAKVVKESPKLIEPGQAS